MPTLETKGLIALVVHHLSFLGAAEVSDQDEFLSENAIKDDVFLVLKNNVLGSADFFNEVWRNMIITDSYLFLFFFDRILLTYKFQVFL